MLIDSPDLNRNKKWSEYSEIRYFKNKHHPVFIWSVLQIAS
jgi:hypothetical protein